MLLAGVCALAGCRREGAVSFGPVHEARATEAPATFRAAAPESFSPSELEQWQWGRVARGAPWQRSEQRSRSREAPYPLDGFDRKLSSGELSCPTVDALDFQGSSLRFTPQAKVIEPFRQKLLAFEQVVRDVSERVYGRWPSAILVAASYGCRSVGGENRKLSEHALGNAIDITGFQFAPAVSFALPAWAPPAAALLGAFQVRVEQHWQASSNAVDATHARFLSELTRELVDRNVFRTLLGPAQPDHSDHFHFDMAPWNYVNL